VPDQGAGYDQTSITITTSSTSTATTGTMPDLAASSVLAPRGTLKWGQSFPVTTDVQNLGQGDAGSFLVRFLLTGLGGSSSDSIFLGDVSVSSLAAGASQQITQTLQLPNRVPAGVTLNSVGYGRIAVIVDPENVVNETLKSNNESLSAPFILRLPGAPTTVPTTAAAGSVPSVAAVAQKDQAALKAAAALKRAARIQARARQNTGKKLHRKQPPKTNSLVDKTISLGTELTKLPHQVFNAIKKSV
jgi:hypothetical protein